MQTNTGIHQKLRRAIQMTGYQYEEEYQAPHTNYVLDFYLPEVDIGLEADGPHHKLTRKRDSFRDKQILDSSNINVIRFDFRYIEKTKHEEISRSIIKLIDAIIEERQNQ